MSYFQNKESVDTQNQEPAVVVFGNRAIFYYPPGCKMGWTFKRIVAVSLFGYLSWSFIFMAIAWTVSFLERVWL